MSEPLYNLLRKHELISKYLLAPSQFRFAQDFVGHGASGSVLLCYVNDVSAAAKPIRLEYNDSELNAAAPLLAIGELEILCRISEGKDGDSTQFGLNHLVKFLGVGIVQVQQDDSQIVRQDDSLAYYIVTQLAEKRSVPTWLWRQRTPNPSTRLKVLRDVLRGLVYLHRMKIVHLDLKPDNLVVTGEPKSERVLICDFGCSRTGDRTGDPIVIKSELTAFKGAGTAIYMSPEQLAERALHSNEQVYLDVRRKPPASASITTASDIYSFGIIMRDVLFGSPVLPRTCNDFKALPTRHAQRLYVLYEQCCLHEAKDRPTAAYLLSHFEGICDPLNVSENDLPPLPQSDFVRNPVKDLPVPLSPFMSVTGLTVPVTTNSTDIVGDTDEESTLFCQGDIEMATLVPKASVRQIIDSHSVSAEETDRCVSWTCVGVVYGFLFCFGILALVGVAAAQIYYNYGAPLGEPAVGILPLGSQQNASSFIPRNFGSAAFYSYCSLGCDLSLVWLSELRTFESLPVAQVPFRIAYLLEFSPTNEVISFAIALSASSIANSTFQYPFPVSVCYIRGNSSAGLREDSLGSRCITPLVSAQSGSVQLVADVADVYTLVLVFTGVPSAAGSVIIEGTTSRHVYSPEDTITPVPLCSSMDLTEMTGRWMGRWTVLLDSFPVCTSSSVSYLVRLDKERHSAFAD